MSILAHSLLLMFAHLYCNSDSNYERFYIVLFVFSSNLFYRLLMTRIPWPGYQYVDRLAEHLVELQDQTSLCLTNLLASQITELWESPLFLNFFTAATTTPPP